MRKGSWGSEQEQELQGGAGAAGSAAWAEEISGDVLQEKESQAGEQSGNACTVKSL